MSLDQINNLLYVLTVLGQIFIVTAVFYLIFFRKVNNKFINFISRKVIPFSFIIAFIATCGSLYYSEIVGFAPCHLCWFQRVFMYPQVIILGLGLFKKDDSVIDYSLALASMGAIISMYHNYIYYSATPSAICSITSPCTEVFFTGFHYISMPLMALTAFLMIAVLLINKKLKLKNALKTKTI